MKVVTVSVSDEQYKELKSVAKREHRSLSNLISLFLSKGVSTFDSKDFLSEGVSTATKKPRKSAA